MIWVWGLLLPISRVMRYTNVGMFTGRDPGAAVTYTGYRPGLLDAADRPHGLAVAHGEHGVIVARHSPWFGPIRYDVRFGQTVVKDVPAIELTTDKWGEAFPAQADRPGSFAGAIDRMLVEDPLVGCLANWILWASGAVIALVYTLAGLRWLGGRVWLWRYGWDIGGGAAAAWVGVAALLSPVAAFCLARCFVFPRRGTAFAGLLLAVTGWSCWYLGSTADGVHQVPVREAAVVAVVGAVLAVVDLFRLRGDDLHPVWFWYPLAVLMCWVAARRYRFNPIPSWQASEKYGFDWSGIVSILVTVFLIGVAVYLCSVAVHQAAVAPGSAVARRWFAALELTFAVVLPLAMMLTTALSVPGFVNGVPHFGVVAEAALMFPFIVLCGSAPFEAGMWLGWRPLAQALRRRGIEEGQWKWVRSCSYLLPPVLIVLYRYL